MNMKNRDSFTIDRVAFIGRTYAEYMKIFDLTEDMLRKGQVLDCPAGAASFAAEAHKVGIDVTACDILYDSEMESLVDKGMQDINHIYDNVKAAYHLFTWNYYKNIDNLISHRKSALRNFAVDYSRGDDNGRYRYAALPDLPFQDNHFSLVLSSHFLFLYGDRLRVDFHIECLRELMRVCSDEVRVYPLTGLNAEPYAYLDDIVSALMKAGINVEITKVPFEFQIGSNNMMILKQNKGGSK